MPSTNTSPVTLAVTAVSGAAIVLYGMQVLAKPMSKETLEQCLVHRKGAYFTAYSGHFTVLGQTTDGVLCMLFGFFNNIAKTLLGKAIGTALASALFPILAIMLIWGAERGKTSTVLFPIIVASVGQLITIGVASNLIWLPNFARSLSKPAGGAAAPSPASIAPVLGVSLVLALAASLPTFVITAAHPLWLYGNFAFQIFPLFFLPVVVAAVVAPRATGSAANRAPYASLLRGIGAISVLVWWLAVSQILLDYGLPTADEGSKRFAKELISPLFSNALVPVWPLRLRPTLATEFNEGARFLVCDSIGLLIAAYTSVLVHAKKTAVSPSLVLSTLIGGPGFALSNYYANHYASVEKQKTG